jgi:hypothetical protein
MPIIGGRGAGVRGLGFQGAGKPNAPINVSATNIGTSRAFNNGAASVSFTSGGSNGSPITSFTVTSSPGGYTASGASSPLTVAGLQSNTAYTFTVTATNAVGTSNASSASSSITATTVPATPSAPSASSPSAGVDRVTWSAPASGGSAITGYTWASSDGKTGSVNGSTTSVDVNQEQGTAQTYTVYATNANGNSSTSSASNNVTTTFSFAPFGFTPFGFTPFGFTPAPPPPPAFVFTPYEPYSFGPPPPWSNSIDINTKIRTLDGLKPAGEIKVGDVLLGLNIPSDLDDAEWTSWISNPDNFTANVAETTVTSTLQNSSSEYVYIDGDLFTPTHYILTKKDNVIKYTKVDLIDNTYQRYSFEENDFVDIEVVEDISVEKSNISIHCEPHDNFFTEQMLVMESLPH